MKVAILDDEPTSLEAVTALFEQAGHTCYSFNNGRELVRALHRDNFDFFVLDWELPDLLGINVVEWIRNQIGTRPPVFLLTGNISDEEVITALRSGADDYLAKPFAPAMLIAKVEALARRSAVNLSRTTESFGPYEFEPTSKTLRASGVAVRMTPKEFHLALLLFRNLNKAVARTYIFETIWGLDPALSTRTLDIHISKIRLKLDLRPEAGYRLSPVYGYGYRLDELRP